MKRRVVCALCVAAVLAAPAAGSPDTPPPAPSADPTAPAPEAPPPPEPTETNRALEEPVEPPPSQTAAGEAPAGEPSPDARIADAPEPPSASKPSRSAQPEARAAAGSVVIRDFEFSPATVTIAAGETVTWTNSGPSEHSATADSFDTGILPNGERGSHTFGTAGTFSYVCTPHPFMKATVRVVASGSPAPPASPGVDPDDTSAAEGAAGAGAVARDGGETLPDTGLDLLPAGVGIALVAAGVALGRAARRSAG